MSAAPSVTVVVCTYNRCESLKDTLRSIAKQVVPQGLLLELIVVDNNSTDRTKAVVGEVSREIPFAVRTLVEKNQGIGYARNRGLLAAQGDYILFIDDDAVAEPDWVASVVRCFEETGADIVGGKIIPLWLAPRPEWLTNDLMGPMPKVDFGQARKPLSGKAAFLTTNCSLRRSKLSTYGMFDVLLGRKGTRWVGGEDFELCWRWMRKNAKVIYEPAAVVHHKVGPERVTPEFYKQWFVDIGYTQAHQMEWKWHHGLSIIPFWRWKKFFAAGIFYLKSRGIGNPITRLQAELWWRFQISFLRERLAHWAGLWRGVQAPACPFSKA